MLRTFGKTIARTHIFVYDYKSINFWHEFENISEGITVSRKFDE